MSIYQRKFVLIGVFFEYFLGFKVRLKWKIFLYIYGLGFRVRPKRYLKY